MDQRKRYGGNNELGYYTSWETNKENGCIYCGEKATTREHIPSKTFLIRPFPENLPTIPACFKCNNSFSNDEKYVSCFLDVLKSYVFDDYKYTKRTKQLLKYDKNLQKLLREQIEIIDGKLNYNYDEKRLLRIIKKLAVGHAGFEFDKITFNRVNDISYDFIFNMSNNQIEEFNSIVINDVLPDIASRISNTSCIMQCNARNIGFVYYNWDVVQENQYRYQVFQDIMEMFV